MRGNEVRVQTPAESSVEQRDPLVVAASLLATEPDRTVVLARRELANTDELRVKTQAQYLIGSAEYRQGQPKDALDPLKEALDGFTALGDESGKLDTLLVLGRVERELGRFEEATTRCRLALELAPSISNHAAQVDALNLHAGISKVQGHYADALKRLEQALRIARKQSLREREGNILSNMGSIHTALGNHSSALECLITAYEIVRETVPGTRAEGTNLLSLGNVYREMGDLDGAHRFFMQARSVGREASDQMLQVAALNNLANVHVTKKEWPEAQQLFMAALELSRGLGLQTFEIDNMDGLGLVHAALGNHSQALGVHAEVLRLAREIGDHEGEVEALLNLGRDHLAMRSHEAAIEVLQEALTLAGSLEHHPTIYQAHELLSQAYELSGDYARALHHHRRFHSVEKRAFNEESEQHTRRLAVQFELERARLEAEQYRLRTEIMQQAREEAEIKVRERTRELEEAQQEIVTRLAIAAEYRDDDTGEHIWRVGRNAAAIARAMGWGEDDVQLIFSAARLHDIGKIGIGDAVLLKPGKLTRDEFELMRGHATIGARILSGGRSRLLLLAEEIALAHHERWDGQGYPLGLAGEDIPISARIVAVADVLDALTHERPYKQPWPVRDALAEIENQAGRQFDPAVVEACLKACNATDGLLSPLDSVESYRGERPIRLGFAHYNDRSSEAAVPPNANLFWSHLEAETSPRSAFLPTLANKADDSPRVESTGIRSMDDI